MSTGPVFFLLLGGTSDYAQPITGQVTEVTCPATGQAQPELTQSKRQKTSPGLRGDPLEQSLRTIRSPHLHSACIGAGKSCACYQHGSVG